MKTWLETARIRWQQFTAAEQRTVRWGAVILLPLLAWALLWQPAHRAVARLQVTVPQLRAQHAAMQAQALEMQSLRQRAQPASLSGETLRRAVAEAAAATALGEANLETQGANEVRLTAESVDYARWLALLRALNEAHHVRVSGLTLTAGATPGLVKVDAVLTSGAEN